MKYLFTLLIAFSTIAPGAQELNIPDPVVDKYRITGGKMWGIGILALASFTDGVLEGYGHQNRHSFERKYGADPYGFWGSQSYTGKKFLNQTWDFYHIADDTRKFGYITAGVVIGINGARHNRKLKHWLFDLAISATISAGCKYVGMKWIKS